ncbi:VWA domain-containing protein [Rapidithrix thailandica]|uniref:VWA domain-containing protein n=1 Tax=Rapidithrix thailandica TaxID=413964 RepID=A0AAW9RTG1_9BACT
MTFYKEFGLFEIFLILIFLGLYGLFMMRTIRISQQVKSKSKAVLLKFALRTCYFVLMLVALLGPSFGEMKKEVQSIGKDIYLAVDLSRSMDAIDIQPSRLEKVKFELKNIVQAFSSDRIGLIVFSSDAFLQCPLTYDQNALLMFIETLNTNLVSNTGTDFSPPMRMALQKHLIEDENMATKQQSKIIILISDGEDFGEETQEVARKIKDEEIKLFTLGVGTDQGSKIPVGYRFKRDRSGNDVITKLNRKPLEKLASLTDGKYFEISNNKNDVSRLISSIEKIKGELRDSVKMDVSANKYFYFLALALVLILLDLLITVKIVKI